MISVWSKEGYSENDLANQASVRFDSETGTSRPIEDSLTAHYEILSVELIVQIYALFYTTAIKIMPVSINQKDCLQYTI